MNTTITPHKNYSVASLTIDNCPVVKAYLCVDLHHHNSAADQAAFAMYGDLLLSGTDKLSREAFLSALSNIGAEIATSVQDGVLTIALTSPVPVWKKVLALTSDLLIKPAFAPTERERVARLIKNAIHDEQENTKRIASEALHNSFYKPNDRHARCTLTQLGTALSQITAADITRLHTRLHANPWTITVVGDKDACDLTTKTFAKLAPKSITPQTRTVATKTTTDRLQLTHIPSKDNIEFSIGCPIALTITDPELPALLFGVAVLAKYGGFAGRLMSIVREKEGLTYSIYGRVTGTDVAETGVFQIGTFFNPPQALQGVTSTFREITNLYKHGITDAEFKSFKTILETQTILRADSPLRQLDTLHLYHKLRFTTDQIIAFEASLLDVTKPGVNHAIKTYLDPQTMIVCGAGPVSTVQKDLEAFIKTV